MPTAGKPSIPVIDISPLLSGSPSLSSPQVAQLAHDLYDACSTWGFFQVVGHGVSEHVQKDLLRCSRDFFALPDEQKLALHVRQGGVAWRGYMPLGGEHTHGKLDHKEGMYFGREHSADHPQAGMPLHGQNQFPDEDVVPDMRATILNYIDQVTELGKTICDAFSLSLDLDGRFIREHYLQPEPIALFRCFKYYLPATTTTAPGGVAAQAAVIEPKSGIGEHTDFGLLTILAQDSPGLQVYSRQYGWTDVPVIENAFVCNVGDMLDMITGGRFKSVPHRVLLTPASSGTPRFSFPFFFDFSWTAKMVPLPLGDHLPPLSAEEEAEAKERWVHTTFTSVSGEWWQYLAKKVMKVFPDLNLPDFEYNATPSSRFAIEVPV